LSFDLKRIFGIATVVREGGLSRRRYGVPPGGPLDSESFELAQCLVGNSLEQSALEIFGGTAELVCTKSTVLSNVGSVQGLMVDGQPRVGNSAIQVYEGEVVQVSTLGTVYLAEPGGWGVGGRGRVARLADPPSSLRLGPIGYLPAEGFESVGRLELTINPKMSRMGIRMDGMGPLGLAEIVSEPCCVGTIQITPSGQLITIGPDGPTLGGYPRLGYVTEVDLDRLAHVSPLARVVLDIKIYEDIELELAERRQVRVSRCSQLRMGLETC